MQAAVAAACFVIFILQQYTIITLSMGKE